LIAREFWLARWEGEGGAPDAASRVSEDSPTRLAASQGTLPLTWPDDEEHTRADKEKVNQAAKQVAGDDCDDPHDE